MQTGLEQSTIVILAMAAFPVSLSLTRFLMWFNSRRGIFGVDVHKLDKPKVPEMCGAAVPITLLLAALLYALVFGTELITILAFSLVVGSSAVVGALDDKYRMRGIYKPALILVCAMPLLILGLLYPGEIFNHTLKIPIFGGFNLPIIYPLVIPIAISVTSNTVNMLDPLNGTMAGAVAIVATGLLIGLLFKNEGPLPIFLFGSLLFSTLGFFYYNKHPSRAFSGNVGQLSIGAALGSMVIIGRVEIAGIVAMFPQIQNSFFFLSRIRKFVEHRQVAAKPTSLGEDAKLVASTNPQSPMTLVRNLLVGKPSSEAEVVSGIFSLFLFTSALGLVTLLLT